MKLFIGFWRNDAIAPYFGQLQQYNWHFTLCQQAMHRFSCRQLAPAHSDNPRPLRLEMNRNGLPCASQTAWIFVEKPQQERHKSCFFWPLVLLVNIYDTYKPP